MPRIIEITYMDEVQVGDVLHLPRSKKERFRRVDSMRTMRWGVVVNEGQGNEMRVPPNYRARVLRRAA